MVTRPTLDAAVESYLGQVRAALRGVPDREADEILLELRGHIAESVEATGDVAATLVSLGDPAELASEYRNEGVVARGECSNAPIAILHGLMLLRHRRRGVGWLVLTLATLGYVSAIALAAAAGEKFLSPRVVGMWQTPRTFLPRIIVDGAAPLGSHELLGWWFVPAGIATFLAVLFATNHFGRWWIRSSRRDADDSIQQRTLTHRGGPVGLQ